MAEINNRLVSSAQECGVCLRERTDWRGAYEKPDGTLVPAGLVKVGWEAEAATPAHIEAAERKVSTGMAPPLREQIIKWLVELSVITARREDDPATEDLRMAAYSSRLAEYPADVVREALLVRRWKFFPAWSELGEVCDALVKPRRDMLAALERAKAEAERRAAEASALPAPGQHHETAEERRVSAESARAIMADVLAGMKSKVRAEEEAEAARRSSAYPVNTQRPEPEIAAE